MYTVQHFKAAIIVIMVITNIFTIILIIIIVVGVIRLAGKCIKLGTCGEKSEQKKPQLTTLQCWS